MTSIITVFLLLVWRKLNRRAREIRTVIKGLASTRHPILAHIVVIRRCNLSCGYCNEFDTSSAPVPVDILRAHVDRLAELGTTIVTLSGGEPLLHPQLDEVIAHIRKAGMMAGVITNGYLLNVPRIQQLNAAGLDYLQISIDNALPDSMSTKSLKVLDQRLQWLASHAEFDVNINSVIGGSLSAPGDSLLIAQRARALGFSSTTGILHDGRGQLRPLTEIQRIAWETIRSLPKRSFARVNGFQDALSRGEPNDWRCRAGARYLYIAEDGRVHRCSQQRSRGCGKPLQEYRPADIEREYLTTKACAPFCTVSCAHQVAFIDHWRDPQAEPDNEPAAPARIPAASAARANGLVRVDSILKSVAAGGGMGYLLESPAASGKGD